MNKSIRIWPIALLLVLLALYGNFWMWDADAIVFGFPVNLLYHVGICAAAAVSMLVVVTFAWPHGLDKE